MKPEETGKVYSVPFPAHKIIAEQLNTLGWDTTYFESIDAYEIYIKGNPIGHVGTIRDGEITTIKSPELEQILKELEFEV